MDRERLKQLTTDQAGLLSWRQMDAAGMPRQRLRTLEKQGSMRRYVHGVYVVVSMAPKGFDAERSRAAWAGLLASAPHGVSSGACALHLHGVQGLPQRLVPEVSAFAGVYRGGVEGVRVRQVRQGFEQYRLRQWRIAAPLPALVQALPEMTITRAVCVLDSALNRNVIQLADVDELRRRLRGRRGVAKLAQCWGLVDGRADSPIETRVRLECVRAGIPPTDLQVRVTGSDGRIIARGDLGWLRDDGTWVLVEVDGVDVHSTPTAVFRDRTRQNRIMLHGRHTTLRFTARDLGTGVIVAQVGEALRM